MNLYNEDDNGPHHGRPLSHPTLGALRRSTSLTQRVLDASAEIRWYRDTPDLRPHREQQVRLECVFTRARGAGLEMRADARYFIRRELTIDVFVHPAKDLFAGVAVQW